MGYEELWVTTRGLLKIEFKKSRKIRENQKNI